jgi:hypothetical protein
MSIRTVSKRFRSIVDKINNNKHDPSHGPLSKQFLEQALNWKMSSVFVNRKTLLEKWDQSLIDYPSINDEVDTLELQPNWFRETAPVLACLSRRDLPFTGYQFSGKTADS